MRNRTKVHIVVDNGNRMTKILLPDEREIVYDSGLLVSDTEPISTERLLKYQEKYYSIGINRMPVRVDKTEDILTFLLTLAAIGEFMKGSDIKELDVTLSVGLPLIHYGRLKDKFKQYFLRDDIIFDYEGDVNLSASITDVHVWPQAYSAALVAEEGLKGVAFTCIDLGGFTCDVCHCDRDGTLDVSSISSTGNGIISLYKAIQQDLFKSGLRISERQIDDVLMQNRPVLLDDSIVNKIERYAEDFVEDLLGTISESYELRLNAVLITGGAGSSLQRFLEASSRIDYVEFADIFSNCRGYKLLTENALKRKHNG